MPVKESATPHPVDASLSALVELHSEAESRVGHAQRAVERVTLQIGRPIVLALVALFVCGWIAANSEARIHHFAVYDSPPFFWLQGLIGLGALLMDTIILITQNRQAQRAELRAQLDLQLSLAAEQRMAKLVALIEELRRDMPNVRDRSDPVAEAMQRPADPAKISSELDSALRDAEPS
jgi:uncharacterized membrane protein